MATPLLCWQGDQKNAEPIVPPISIVCSNARPLPQTKKCDGCGQLKPQGKYSITQWRTSQKEKKLLVHYFGIE
jgi:hypothetical protein